MQIKTKGRDAGMQGCGLLWTCGECGVRYVGETGQHFTERRSQHKRDIAKGKTTNGFCNHVEENKGHKIEWEKVIFLDHEKHRKRRKIKEAIYINAINPTKVVDKKAIMNLEKGYDLDPMWSDFNQVHRQVLFFFVNVVNLVLVKQVFDLTKEGINTKL